MPAMFAAASVRPAESDGAPTPCGSVRGPAPGSPHPPPGCGSPPRHPPPAPRRCGWPGPIDSPGQSGSRSDSGLRGHNQKPPRHGWPAEAQIGFRLPGATGRRMLNKAQFQHACFRQQPHQTRMHLGRGIEGRDKQLPLLRIQLEALPVGQHFGRAGQGVC